MQARYFIKLLKTGTPDDLSNYLTNQNNQIDLSIPLTDDAETAFHIAAQYNIKIIPTLLETGKTNLSAVDAHGRTALQCMLNNKLINSKIAILMIQNGADVNTTDKRGGTLLHILAKYCKPKSALKYIPKLLELGANLSLEDDNKRTAFRCFLDNKSVHTTMHRDAVLKLLNDNVKKDNVKKVSFNITSTVQEFSTDELKLEQAKSISFFMTPPFSRPTNFKPRPQWH